MQTLTGRFNQIGPDGTRTTGQFFIAKPGKVRFHYARPSTLDIIADGSSVVVRDRALNTQDLYPLSQTPLRYLLQTNLDLQRDAQVIGVSRDQDLVSVTVEEDSTFGGKARLTIVLGGEPFQLKQWTITDAQGLDTTVLVSQLDANSRPDSRLFTIDYMSDAMNQR
jgi:outer membrane lipoprotein-sorting protein